MDYYRELRLWTYRFYQVRQWDGKQLHLRQAARMFARGNAHFAGWYHHAEQVQVVLVVGGLYPRYHQQCCPAGLGREEQGEARRSIQPQLCLRRHQSSDFGKRKDQNGVVSIGYDLRHHGRAAHQEATGGFEQGGAVVCVRLSIRGQQPPHGSHADRAWTSTVMATLIG